MDRRGNRQAAPLPWRPTPPGPDRDATPGRERARVPAPALPWLLPAAPPAARRAVLAPGPPVTRPRDPVAGRVERGRGEGWRWPDVARAPALEVLARIRARGPAAVGGAVLLVLALVAAGAVGVAHLVSGGTSVSTPFLSYRAPAGWTAEPAPVAALDTPTLTGAVRGPGYDCGGETHVRGFVAAALLPLDPATAGAATGPADRADRLARWFAAAAYGAGDGTAGDRASGTGSAGERASGSGTAPEVVVTPARPVRVEGAAGPADGSVVEATVRAPARGACPAVEGTVVALAAPVSGGAATLLVAGDTAGGPADPAPVDRATLDAVVASVRLVAPPADAHPAPPRP